jgi:hypothetical protein
VSAALAVMEDNHQPKPWQDYCEPARWHEAANIFPLVPDQELQDLAVDIKKFGLKNPIVLLNDKVLDGRNRLLACRLAGVNPKIESRNPDKLGSPVAWVLSQNLQRRHLDAGQRAMIATKAETQFAVEAKQRQGARTDIKAKLPESPKGQARDHAAATCHVSPRYVQDAKKVVNESPKLAAKVESGAISLPEAKKALDLAKKLEPINPAVAARVRSGDLKPRDAEKITAKKVLRTKYSEPDYFARVGRALATSLTDPRLVELSNMKKKDFTPEANEGLQNLILNLKDVEKRARFYRERFSNILKGRQ